MPKKSSCKTLVLITILAVNFFFPASQVFSLPTDEQIESGTATFDRAQENMLNVIASDQSIIQWGSFNIGANETVNFTLPSADAFSLNRIIGGGTSQILGQLNVNGNLVLVNQNGFYFGPAAVLNVGGLMASAHDITNANFLAGQYIFAGVNNAVSSSSSVLNDGTIRAAEGGNVALIGDAVENRGVIEAPIGTVSLAAGKLVTVQITGSGWAVGVDEATAHQILDKDGNPITEQLKNSGTLSAQGGKVAMNAKSVSQLFSRAVNLEGVVWSDTLAPGQNGSVQIIAEGGDVRLSADVHAAQGQIQVSTTANMQIQGTYDAAGGDMVFEAEGDLTITGETSTSGNTTFRANQNIRADSNITTDSGDLVLQADADMNGAGAFLQAQGTTLKTTTSGDITISASGESTLANIESAGDLILQQAGAPVRYTQFADSAVSVNGSLSIGTGVTLSAANTLYEVSMNWMNLGNFDAQLSEVRLVGNAPSTLTGATTFYDFTVIEPGKIVNFPASEEQAVLGTLTLQGGHGNLLLLRSTAPGMAWKINAVGTTNLSYLDVMDSSNINIHGPPLAPQYSKNSSGNSGWDFSAGVVWIGNESLNWSDAGNWDGGFLPGQYDVVRFTELSGLASVVNVQFEGSIAGLKLDAGFTGIVSLERNLTVSGNVELNGGTLQGNSHTVTVGGDWSSAGGMFEAGSSTVVFNDASRTTHILGNNTFFNFTSLTPSKIIAFEAGKTQIILGTWKLQGDYFPAFVKIISTQPGSPWYVDPRGPRDLYALWIEDAHNLNPVEVYVQKGTNRGGSFNIDPTFTWTGGDAGNQDWSDGDNWDQLGATPGAGDDVVFDGTNTEASTVDAGFDGGNNGIGSLSINAGYTNTITLQKNLLLTTASGRSGSITINAGTLDSNGFNITVGGSWTDTGAGAFTEGTSTVTFLNSVGTINANEAFYHVIIDGGTVDLAGNFDVNGNFTLQNGGADQFDQATYTMNVAGDFACSFGCTFVKSSNNSALTFDGTGILNISFQDLGVVVIGGTTTTRTLTNSVTMTTLTINSGNTFDIDGNDIVLTTLNNNGTFELSGTAQSLIITNWDIDSGLVRYAPTISGVVNIRDFTGVDYFDLELVAFDDFGSFNGFNGLDVDGDFTVTNGSLTFGVHSWSVAGDFIVAATAETIFLRDSTVTFDGTGSIQWSPAFPEFGDVIFGGTNTTRTLLSNMTMWDITVNSGNTFYLNGFNLTDNPGSSVVNNSGTIRLNGSETITDYDNFDVDSGTVEYVGSGAISIKNFGSPDYFNLRINGSGTFTANSHLDVDGDFELVTGTLQAVAFGGSMNVAGDFTLADGTTFTAAFGVVLDGSGDLSDNHVVKVNLGPVTISGNSTRTLATDIKMDSLLINSGSTFALAGNDFTFQNFNTAVNNSGTFRLNGDETLSGVRNFDTDSGTVEYVGTGGPYNIKEFDSFNCCSDYFNLTINGSGATFNLTSALRVDGAFTLNAGTVAATQDMDFNGTVTVGNTAATTLDITNRTVNFAGTVNLTNLDTFTVTGSTAVFDGNTTLTSDSETWNNVTVAGTLALADSFVMSGDLTMTSGSLSGTSSVTVNGGDVTGNGDITLTGGTFTLDGGGNFGGNTDWDFFNLIFGDGVGLAASLKTGTGDINVAGNMTIVEVLQVEDVDWTIAGDLTINGILTDSVGDTAVLGTIRVNGGDVSGSGLVFLQNSSTLILDGSGTWGGGNWDFRNVTLGDGVGAQTTTSTGNLTLHGNLVIAANHNFVIESSVSLLNGDLTVTGNISQSVGATVQVFGGDVTGNGDITFTAGSFLLDGAGNFGGDTAWDFFNLTFGNGTDATTTTKTGAGAINVAGSMTIAANQSLNIGDDAWTVTGDLTVTGNISAGTGTVTVNGGDVTGNGDITLTAGTFTLDGTGNFGGNTNWDFNNLTFGDGAGAATTTKTGSGAIAVAGNMSIAANQNLDAGDDTWTVTGDLTVTGNISAGTGSIAVSGGDVTGNGDITLTAGTFTLDGTGNFGGNTNWDFNNLTFGDGAGAATTTKTGSGSVAVAGNLSVAANQNLNAGDDIWTVTGDLAVTGNISAGTGTITVNGGDVTGNGDITLTAGTFTLDGTGNFGGSTDWDFFHLTFGNGIGSATTTKTGSGSITAAGTLTIAANQILDAGDDTWNVAGNWVNSGSLTPGTSTVNLNGADQSIFGNNSFWTLSKIITSAATLTFEAGMIQNIVGTNTLILKGEEGELLSLRSSNPGTTWDLDAQGNTELAYLDVQDSNNVGTGIFCTTGCVDNPGTNTGWAFSFPAAGGSESFVNLDQIFSALNDFRTELFDLFLPTAFAAGSFDAQAGSNAVSGPGSDPENFFKPLSASQVQNFMMNSPDVWESFGTQPLAEKMVSETKVIEGEVETSLYYKDSQGNTVKETKVISYNQTSTVSGTQAPVTGNSVKIKDFLMSSPEVWVNFGGQAMAKTTVSETKVIEGEVENNLHYTDSKGNVVKESKVIGYNQTSTVNGTQTPMAGNSMTLNAFMMSSPEVWVNFGSQAMAQTMVSETKVIEGEVETSLQYKNSEGKTVTEKKMIASHQTATVEGTQSPAAETSTLNMKENLLGNPEVWSGFGSMEYAGKVSTEVVCQEGRVVTTLNYRNEQGQWVRNETVVNDNEKTQIRGLDSPEKSLKADENKTN